MHHDRDAVYTSYDWLQMLLIRDRARVSYAERGARDNPWIESMWGHFEGGERFVPLRGGDPGGAGVGH